MRCGCDLNNSRHILCHSFPFQIFILKKLNFNFVHSLFKDKKIKIDLNSKMEMTLKKFQFLANLFYRLYIIEEKLLSFIT